MTRSVNFVAIANLDYVWKFSLSFLTDSQTDELRYVYQRIGFQCLTETLFDDAGRHLFDGGLDPRALISYFPDLCGDPCEIEGSVDLFSEVAECMPSEESIDDNSESLSNRRPFALFAFIPCVPYYPLNFFKSECFCHSQFCRKFFERDYALRTRTYLTRFRRIAPLCRLYRQRGDDLKLLEAWSKCVPAYCY